MEGEGGKGVQGEGSGGKRRAVPPLLSLHFKHWPEIRSNLTVDLSQHAIVVLNTTQDSNENLPSYLS